MDQLLSNLSSVMSKLENVAPQVWAAALKQTQVIMAIDQMWMSVWIIIGTLVLLLGVLSVWRMSLRNGWEDSGWGFVVVFSFVMLIISIVSWISLRTEYFAATMNPEWMAIQILVNQFKIR